MATRALARRSSPVRRVTRVVRVSGRSRKKQLTIPVAVVAGFAPGALRIWNFRDQGVGGMLNQAAYVYTGFDSNAGKFDLKGMKYGLAPVAAGFLIHKLASMFGVNRMLAQAGVPFVRI